MPYSGDDGYDVGYPMGGPGVACPSPFGPPLNESDSCDQLCEYDGRCTRIQDGRGAVVWPNRTRTVGSLSCANTKVSAHSTGSRAKRCAMQIAKTHVDAV